MKYLLLYIFVCISTCLVAQSFPQAFVSADDYGISSNFDNNPNVAIYPNPTSDIIHIEDKDGAVSTATIFNLLGKEIASFQVNEVGTYDMMDLQKGIYLIQLKDKNKQILQTVRVKKI